MKKHFFFVFFLVSVLSFTFSTVDLNAQYFTKHSHDWRDADGVLYHHYHILDLAGNRVGRLTLWIDLNDCPHAIERWVFEPDGFHNGAISVPMLKELNIKKEEAITPQQFYIPNRIDGALLNY